MQEEEKKVQERADITALTFTLDGEIFALDINYVIEVLEYVKITKVPRTPLYMLGVINLRGNVAAVVDLKMKFNMPPSEQTVDTCIIIVEVNINGARTIVGILADSVKEVFDFDIGAIEETPRLGLDIDMDFLKGIARQKDDFVMIIEINKIFSPEEIREIENSQKIELAY